MLKKFMMISKASLANPNSETYPEGAPTMRVENFSESEKQQMTIQEPWHRGSAFTWLLFGLAGLVFFLTANS